MSEFEGIVTYTFHWFSVPPSCPECTALHGRVIRGQSLEDSAVLIDPVTSKPIWDLYKDKPLTHGGTGINCDCHLEVTVDVDLSKAAWFQELLTETRRIK